MGSAVVQGDLWGRAPGDWAEIQEVQHAPLWEAAPRRLLRTLVRRSRRRVHKETPLRDVGLVDGDRWARPVKRGRVDHDVSDRVSSRRRQVVVPTGDQNPTEERCKYPDRGGGPH